MGQKTTYWTLNQMPDQTGRRMIVTGAGSGLGAIVAREFAARGAEVVLAVRDLGKGEQVAEAIRRAHPEARCRVDKLDLADLASVDAFAARMLDDDIPLDILVLNAGIANQPHVVTADGIESTFATNVVGHFVLTDRLLPLLERGDDARVVSVGSNLYRRFRADLDFGDLTFGHDHSPSGAYVRSKVATVLFATELERRLRGMGSSVRSFIAHPGMSTTPMHDSATGILQRMVVAFAHATISRDADEGALPILYAATSEDAQVGRFIGWHSRRSDKRIWSDEFVGAALDVSLAQQLWTRLSAVGIDEDSRSLWTV